MDRSTVNEAPPATVSSRMAATGSVTEQALSRNPELAGRLQSYLLTVDPELRQLDHELQSLEVEFDDLGYAEAIYQLGHLRFAPAEAKRHWRALVEHHRAMETKLGTTVDLRVALVSYFIEVVRQLESPTVIEMRLLEQTRALAYRDELTGLNNYRFFVECLEQEILRAQRDNSPVSFIMCDLDDFKRYNDRYGHEAGNRALSAVGAILRRTTRQLDIAARFGGEEFAIIVPATPKTGATLVAERMREEVERTFGSPAGNQGGGPLTVSIGVSTFPADARNAVELVRTADRALYNAKTAGKNRVRLYRQSSRSFERVAATLEGELRTLEEAAIPIETVDLSEGGLRFRTRRNLPVGSLIEIRLTPPDSQPALETTCRVTSSGVETDDGAIELAARIVDMSSEARRRLSLLLDDFASDLDAGHRGGPPPR